MERVMDQTAATARGRDTRQRIVESARVLVRRHGVAGTSLKDVERDAGVGRSQTYHYFGDREALLRAVVGANADALVSRAEALLSNVEHVADLSRWLDAVVEANQAGDDLGCPLGSLINQLDLQDQGTRATLSEAFIRWRAPLIAALAGLHEQGRLSGQFGDEDLADQVMCLIQGGLLMSQLHQDPRQLELAVEAAKRYLALAAAD